MDCSRPGSCVHGILQERILEWVAMPSSSMSSRPRYRFWVSYLLHWHLGSLLPAPPGKSLIRVSVFRFRPHSNSVLEKVSFHSNPKKGQCQRISNYCTIALISHASKVMLKILQARFNSTWTMNFQMFKLVLEKAEEPEIKLPTSAGSSKKKWEFQKNICFCFINYAKAFDCVDHNKLWKILKEMGIPDHLTCLLISVCRSRSNS